MAAAIDPDVMKKLATPKYQLGQYEWPTGWLVKVDVFDEEDGLGQKHFVLAETGQREAKAALDAIRQYVQDTLTDDRGEFMEDRHFEVERWKNGLTVELVWQPDGDDPDGSKFVEASVHVWYEQF